MLLEPFEWEQGARECVEALLAHAAKLGWEQIEVWAEYIPGGVKVHVTNTPQGRKDAVYRGRVRKRL